MENLNSSAMYSVQGMRKFVCDRLTEAAQEILGAFEKRAQEYEGELARQRRLLESVFTKEAKIRGTDLQGSSIKEEQHDISISDIQQPAASTSVQDVHRESQSLDKKEAQNAGRKEPEQASTPQQETEEPGRRNAPDTPGTHEQTSAGSVSATPTKQSPKCSHGYRLPKTCVSKQKNRRTNKDKPVLLNNTESSLMEVIEIMDNSPASSDIEVIQDYEEAVTNPNGLCETTEADSEKAMNKKSKCKNSEEIVRPSQTKSSERGTFPASPSSALVPNQDEIEDDTTCIVNNAENTFQSSSNDMPFTSLDLPNECFEPEACSSYMTLLEDMLHNEESKIFTRGKSNDESFNKKSKSGKESSHNIPTTSPNLETIVNNAYNELKMKNNEESLLDKCPVQTKSNKDPIENMATTSSTLPTKQTDDYTPYICNEQSILKTGYEETIWTSTTNLEAIQSELYYLERNSPAVNTTLGQERPPGQKTSEKSPFECDRCGKVLSNFKNYKFHMKSHTVEKSFKCETCGKMFRESWDLNKHQIIHTGEKPFKCTDCGRGFNRRFNLDLHMRVHTGEKPYACSSCEKAFTSRVNLKKHERIHTGEKPYTCEHCKKEFADSSSFRNHQRVHTGEKPYKCSWCKKRFATRTTLKRHIRVHTGEKPYKCSVCEKSFATNTDMKVHFRIHTGEKPYKCENCGQNFSSWTNYNRHTNIHKHSETRSTEPPV